MGMELSVTPHCSEDYKRELNLRLVVKNQLLMASRHGNSSIKSQCLDARTQTRHDNTMIKLRSLQTRHEDDY
jgi:hypothetical protein